MAWAPVSGLQSPGMEEGALLACLELIRQDVASQLTIRADAIVRQLLRLHDRMALLLREEGLNADRRPKTGDRRPGTRDPRPQAQ